MIYLIGGVPGMRKSSLIKPCFLAKKNIYNNSTDLIRASTSNLYWKLIGDPHVAEYKSVALPSFELKGEDVLAWIGAIGLIRLFNSNRYDILIEGVAITPAGVRDLEIEYPDFQIKAAFVGYTKPMEFQPPEWNFELENSIKSNIHEEYLEVCKEHGWIYENMHVYDDQSERSSDIKNAVEKLDRPNFKFFDVVESVPQERKLQEPVKLQLNDFIENAVKVRSFLLE